jgi:peptidoglycan hydrolase-like protein with peptidoglycan-binding domain
MVEQGQRWVNNTYGAVAGYQRCAEDGLTGWNTMYSLTMGLQHELGISPVAAAFGPTTLARLTARGDIDLGEANFNIINIIRYALWAKGYTGGYIMNEFDSHTISGIAFLREDAGLNAESVVTPKLFKAMLTMDAYKITSGGRDEIREAQQWLNGRYWSRSTYFIGPCDGHFSRGVQQALMKAIQYEVGIPEADANGNFGPGTQARLHQRFDATPLASGDTSVFTRLFSAACVFNGAVDGNLATFVGTYGSSLAEWVGLFQDFSALGVTAATRGKGTYDTWAQLLVSTGNADRPVKACDTADPLTLAEAQALVAAGYTHVGRYLENHPGPDPLEKKIQPGELGAIFAAGLRVIPIWQMSGNELSDFDYPTGYQHARSAHVSAESHGIRRASVLYFAVDYDATDGEISSNIVPYFRGVQDGLASLGRRYIAGAYGSRNVCARAAAEAFTRYSYVSGMSWGFSGNLGFPLPSNWAFNQIKEFTFSGNGVSFPLDNVARRPNGDNGAGDTENTDTLADALVYVNELYRLAVEWDHGDPNQRVMEYLRFDKYTNEAWDALIGNPDPDWLNWVDAELGGPLATFVDPFTGTTVNLDHFGATANATFVKGTGSPTGANRGDFGGWGGDLSTLYGQWQARESDYASGYAYVMDHLAVPDVSSSFSLGDLIEDVDGCQFGLALRNDPSVRFPDLFSLYYWHGWGSNRFDSFWEGRYGASMSNAFDSARAMLTDLGDVELMALRTAAIRVFGGVDCIEPAILPSYKLNSFLDGYVAKLMAFLSS